MVRRADAQCRQTQANPRLLVIDTMMLVRVFCEAKSYREKANVVDYAVDRVGSVSDGLVVPREPIEVLSMSLARSEPRGSGVRPGPGSVSMASSFRLGGRSTATGVTTHDRFQVESQSRPLKLADQSVILLPSLNDNAIKT